MFPFSTPLEVQKSQPDMLSFFDVGLWGSKLRREFCGRSLEKLHFTN